VSSMELGSAGILNLNAAYPQTTPDNKYYSVIPDAAKRRPGIQ
jgi:hypothetical protein